MDIREQENQLFAALRENHPSVVIDGVVSEKAYRECSCKILYVLKEVNGGQGWDLRDYLYQGGRPQTWDNIARWTEAILNLDQHFQWQYMMENTRQRREQYLKKIAVLNLKKEPGSHTANQQEVALSAVRNSTLIQNQVALYEPDMIICCGTASDFCGICYPHTEFNWKMTSRGIWYLQKGSKLLIAYSHPAARISDCILHYALVDAVREILSRK